MQPSSRQVAGKATQQTGPRVHCDKSPFANTGRFANPAGPACQTNRRIPNPIAAYKTQPPHTKPNRQLPAGMRIHKARPTALPPLLRVVPLQSRRADVSAAGVALLLRQLLMPPRRRPRRLSAWSLLRVGSQAEAPAAA
eukprot:349681-Chlamydomonas_euryale.AAC.8